MVMKLLVVVGADVAAGEDFFEVLEEGGVHGHDVFEVAVDGAVFHHEDFAVALDDLGLDLAGLFVHQDFERQLAVDDLLADFRHALGAKGIGGARPAERRLGFLVRLQKRLIRPLGRKRRILVDAVYSVEYGPRAFGCNGDRFFNVLDRFMHSRLAMKLVAALSHRDRRTSATHYDIYRLRGGGVTANEDRPNGRKWQFSGNMSH